MIIRYFCYYKKCFFCDSKLNRKIFKSKKYNHPYTIKNFNCKKCDFNYDLCYQNDLLKFFFIEKDKLVFGNSIKISKDSEPFVKIFIDYKGKQYTNIKNISIIEFKKRDLKKEFLRYYNLLFFI